MTTAEIAREFAAMCRAGQHREAAARFNAPDIVSLEAMEGPMARVEGAQAVEAKAAWWFDNHTVHGGTVDGPFVNGDQFALVFHLDFTPKHTGERAQSTEVALYTLREGKVVEERFLY